MPLSSDIFRRQLRELYEVCQALRGRLHDIQTAAIQHDHQDVMLQHFYTDFAAIVNKLRTAAHDTRVTADYLYNNLFSKLLEDMSNEAKIQKLDEFIRSNSFRNKRSAVTAFNFNPTAIRNRFETLLGALRMFSDFYQEVEQFINQFKEHLRGNGVSVQIVKPVTDWMARISVAIVDYENQN
ncbi:unnamed protein product [Somion occarium]|uniref:Uncharacterized protein n=1 Tax=Somion occarium TaxID=3059160 RepID=A0ABP1E9Y1_9APHY